MRLLTGLGVAVSAALVTGVVVLGTGHDTGLAAAPGRPVCVTAAIGPAQVPADGWTGAWSTAMQDLTGPTMTGRTLRQLVHPTLGGSSFRIRLANTFGTEPLRIGQASAALARAAGSPRLKPGTSQAVTFGGRAEVVVPAGGLVVSDPVRLAFGFGSTLAVDLRPEGEVVARTGHNRAVASSFLTGSFLVDGESGAFSDVIGAWYWLAGIDVPAAGGSAAGAGAVSVFGDSIAEGANSTRDTNQRWPDLLSRRLRAGPATSTGPGVLNEGIGGNRVLSDNTGCASPSASGLRRFDHDVLSRADVRVVVIALGINDIGAGAPAGEVIGGLSSLARRAHEHGLRVIGATLTPFGCPAGCLSAQRETQRRLVNDWIRTTPDFDAVADFDRALSDPLVMTRLRPAYDSGDHLHPSDAGMAALARAFDLSTLATG